MIRIQVLSSVCFLLLYSGDLRYLGFRFVGDLPRVVSLHLLKKQIKLRDFNNVKRVLNTQLQYVQFISEGHNQVLDGMLSNIQYAVKHAITEEELDYLEPFMEKIVGFYPDLYSMRIAYIKTLLNNEKSKQHVFEQIDKAIELLSSAPESYRLAIKAARHFDDKEKEESYCDMYYMNQSGSINSINNRSVFDGVGISEFALSVKDESNNNRNIILNSGLQVKNNQYYEFILDSPMHIDKMQLLFPSYTGTLVSVNSIDMYFEGKKINSFIKDKIKVSTKNGYILNDGVIFIVNNGLFEVIDIATVRGNDRDFIADKLIINISLSRAGFTNNILCSGG